ncbi:5e58743a-94f1-4a58-8ac2-8e12c387261f [Sclerotinia trifoliorum]|uniref:5e58743a-94f1-4a58-8ac2-8e12c387261f n=1 Tax=Sclerotinia trifoliorum TaxID=28548 RepID=A0A8H2VY37_9HELO|nr:5e58743a-94f1-4a58-8ac2-8e12c387261f [Sclerotinia trifoliorum]
MDAISQTHPLVWIDCEMTGLDIEKDVIIEISCIITNGNLEILDEEGWSAVIHQDKETMDKMDEWCTKTHASTGLTSEVLSSRTTPDSAANSLLYYIKKYIPQPRRGVLAGNSVHADKAFLSKGPYKKVIDHLHYRILDVSSINEAAKRWCDLDVLVEQPRKKKNHRGRDDIEESIEEARYWKERVFNKAK